MTSSLFDLTPPAAPPAPQTGARRRNSMPARHVFPGDIVALDGGQRHIVRVELDGDQVRLFARAGGSRSFPADQVLTVFCGGDAP